ncbi:MAG: helix-hairpin-helix domain-containing protein, partial [Chloroflexota bacterium]
GIHIRDERIGPVIMKEEKEENLLAEIFALGKKLPIGTAFVFFAIGSVGTLVFDTWANWNEPAPIYFQPAPPTATPMPTSTPEPVTIFINGQVAQPGIYTLPYDSMVQDALNAAGGFTAEAFEDVVNLAQPLTDGMQVYVPAKDDSAAVAIPLISTPPIISKDGVSSGLINLNSATKAELETLPGVGPSTAQKILDFREDNGSFSTIEGVMDVAGIGPAKFEQMAEFITVDG